MQARHDPKYGHLPVHFEPNLGQASEQVRYYSHGDGYQLLVTNGRPSLSA